MVKQKKLDAIYEAMADKTLSYGCIISYQGCVYSFGNAVYNFDSIDISWQGSSDTYSVATKDVEIIGHPVRIGDVLDYITVSFFEKDLYWYRVCFSRLIPRWDKPRLPIDAQSEECIDFVYSLITK